ncbi:Npun_F0813 family protein [Calothrix sp. PCC 6303]|uniref:Npun_F0813 family protein n=1 Tax=Calothrix sp. PCC 6303 TaxID=1170562 RepID=UPI0002A04B90|nr:Npun_F0813 family protein [Calothrix sp. PCC 6303]AFZ00508.1 hypothetical protein Cal6303_1459 [Calothrix sp. PCC 6303]
MFILKRQDVEISTIQHPKRDQQLPILYYQGQSFRLISVFKASQEEEAKAVWRELTDNRGKACVLLEEPERYSVWGKIRLDQLSSSDTDGGQRTEILLQAAILLLQNTYMDIEEYLGTRQANLFEEALTQTCSQRQLPQTNSSAVIKHLLNLDPLQALQLPHWQENHVLVFLEELHRLGKEYFGNSNFARSVADKLQDMPEGDRSFVMMWLKQSSVSKMWH